MRYATIIAVVTATLLMPGTADGARARGGRLQIRVVDAETGEPLICRMYLKNAAGRPQRVRGIPLWHDHLPLPGEATLRLPRGVFTFEIERGPEYVNATGHFTIEDHADDSKVVELRRAADMAAEGWISGDLGGMCPAQEKEIELRMQAADLHVAAWIVPPAKGRTPRGATPRPRIVRFDGNRFSDAQAGHEVAGSEGLRRFEVPLEQGTAGADNASQPTPAGTWFDVPRPAAWDLPLWLARGEVNSIGLAGEHLGHAGPLDSGDERPADETVRAPAAWRGGIWGQTIYYHVLNCGLRIPPSAASGGGDRPNPLGYNRVYVHTGGDFDYRDWWEAFRAGRVVVTNGPLLRPFVEGRLPGYVFSAVAGDEIDLEVNLNLTIRDPVEYLEVVKNGEVEHLVRLDDWVQRQGRLPPLEFDESGWFLIRAVAEVPGTYRFASTGPYYVQIGDEPRISRRSVEFFLGWLNEAAARRGVTGAKAAEYEAARRWWLELLDRANAM